MPYEKHLMDNTARRQTTLCHLLPLGRLLILVLSHRFSDLGSTSFDETVYTRLDTHDDKLPLTSSIVHYFR